MKGGPRSRLEQQNGEEIKTTDMRRDLFFINKTNRY